MIAAADLRADQNARYGKVEIMRVSTVVCLALTLAITVVGVCDAQTSNSASESPYGQDLISVVSADRHDPSNPTGNCIVWTNAEGLGVGKAQLNGYHGLSMNINPHPLPGEHVSGFEAGLALLKRDFPTAPTWMFAALEKNRTAIEKACGDDHAEPVRIYALTAKDKGD